MHPHRTPHPRFSVTSLTASIEARTGPRCRTPLEPTLQPTIRLLTPCRLSNPVYSTLLVQPLMSVVCTNNYNIQDTQLPGCLIFMFEGVVMNLGAGGCVQNLIDAAGTRLARDRSGVSMPQDVTLRSRLEGGISRQMAGDGR